jgi:hypothetical protein
MGCWQRDVQGLIATYSVEDLHVPLLVRALVGTAELHLSCVHECAHVKKRFILKK